MTCREADRLLPELLDGVLDEGRRAALDDHVASCARCRQLVQQLDDSLAIFIAHQPALEAPAQEKLWRRVRTEALERTGSRGRLWATALVPSLAGAAAVVAVAIALWAFRPERGASDRHMASVPSAGMSRSAYVAPDTAVTEAAPAGAPATTPDTIARAAPAATPRSASPRRARRTPPVAAPDDEAASAAPEPAEPTETHNYALVVAEWTVREYDQVLTIAEAGASSERAAPDAEPVRTSLYAVVPKSYAVRATTHVFDDVAGEEIAPPIAPSEGESGDGGAAESADTACAHGLSTHVL